MTMRWMLLCLALAVSAAAAPQRFTSGAARTHLLELYSSEGCSSCPPAEQWLGGLREHPGLWRDFVPVAFHVNYWDRLGWPDRFASREFTAREYAYAELWNARTVYTPCFVLNGADQRNRVDERALGATREAAGVLSADYAAAGELRVDFRPAVDGADDFEVHASILGGGVVSKVRAGENGGRTLRHEFIALSLVSARLSDGKARLSLPVPAVEGVTRHALAVWVTRCGRLEPVQATGGWLPTEE